MLIKRRYILFNINIYFKYENRVDNNNVILNLTKYLNQQLYYTKLYKLCKLIISPIRIFNKRLFNILNILTPFGGIYFREFHLRRGGFSFHSRVVVQEHRNHAHLVLLSVPQTMVILIADDYVIVKHCACASK